MNGAKLKGSIINTGGRDANVTVYWGDTNASTTSSSWANNYNLGVNGAVALAHDVTGLTVPLIISHLRELIFPVEPVVPDGPPYRASPPLPR